MSIPVNLKRLSSHDTPSVSPVENFLRKVRPPRHHHHHHVMNVVPGVDVSTFSQATTQPRPDPEQGFSFQ